MLCQLVCIDKRYHKINCFNISEAQSLLKKKFFSDLIFSNQFKKDNLALSSTLKFKTSNIFFENNNNISNLFSSNNFNKFGVVLIEQNNFRIKNDFFKNVAFELKFNLNSFTKNLS
jgi:hypothetical protein